MSRRFLAEVAWYGLGAIAATDLVVDEVLLTGLAEGSEVVPPAADDLVDLGA